MLRKNKYFIWFLIGTGHALSLDSVIPIKKWFITDFWKMCVVVFIAAG